MALATRNFFLDTNIYEDNNFFHSTSIQSLFNYSRSGFINLYLTDISRLELIDRMNKNLLQLRDDYNSLIKKINKSRILKNIPDFANISQPLIEPSQVLSQLNDKLDRIINNNRIIIINSTSINCYEVFYSYFNVLPPFTNSKPTEFKDAFILKAVEAWCISNRKKMIFVTKDENFCGYKNSRVILKSNLTNLLEQISEVYDVEMNVRIIPTIEKSLERNKRAILDLLDEDIKRVIMLDIDYEMISNIRISTPKYIESKIVSLRSNYAEVNYFVEIGYSFTILPSVRDINRAIFEDNLRPHEIKDIIVLNCDLEIPFHNPDNIRLKWVNSNERVRITL